METKKKQLDPIDEPRTSSVSVSIGKTHLEALQRWSKEQFGRENRAGFLVWMIDERLKKENGQAPAGNSGGAS